MDIGWLQTGSQQKTMAHVGKINGNSQATDGARTAAPALVEIAKTHDQWTQLKNGRHAIDHKFGEWS